MESSSSPNKAVIAAVVVVLLVLAATAVIVLGNNRPATDSGTTASDLPLETNSSTPSDETAGTTSDSFKDGTYSSTGSYQTPGGVESIKVEVTLADGVITNANVTSQGRSSESKEYQSLFLTGYKSQVVGKKVSEVSLSRVAGSSLTPQGFNNALNDIEKQAQA